MNIDSMVHHHYQASPSREHIEIDSVEPAYVNIQDVDQGF